MKNLISISFLFALTSCSSIYENMSLVGVKKFEDIDINPILSEEFNSAVFNVEFEVAGNYFSGTLFIKQTSTLVYKSTIINNAGMNIISFKFDNRKFSLISCLEELRNKYIIKTFEDDFRNILYMPGNSYLVNLLKNEENLNIYMITDSGSNLYYFLDTNFNIYQLDLVRQSERVVSYIFTYNTNSTISQIDINHYNFPLDIKLTLTKME